MGSKTRVTKLGEGAEQVTVKTSHHQGVREGGTLQTSIDKADGGLQCRAPRTRCSGPGPSQAVGGFVTKSDRV